MYSTEDIKESSRSPLADAWAELQAHADHGEPLQPDAYRLAFADPEFLLRRETRGIRFQLELLKPDLGLQAAGVHNTVVVYGGARFVAPDVAQARLVAAQAGGDTQAIALAERAARTARYYADAREFGRIVATYSLRQPQEEKLFICTGGGPGVMEAANRGAHDVGVPSVGLNIALPHEQQTNPYVTPRLAFKFHYFALRKMHFLMRARALVAFPGGFGTLDELFEVLTLVQTRKAQPVPIVLYGSDYWRRLLDLQVLVDEGAISPEDLDLYQIVDSPEDAWSVIRRFYGL
ncbi:TIGR00730 family Rossman fold protein [Ottowia sp.]|uniref:LOG family protein n=1 Tax=Ottowia sp. TaxID=1898956 RepID=UPI002BDF97C4|nr:TIGR00730 family Rossman fold protein [Ottowia sp.]HOB65691.1 TIGR00730 family Rossman fold protein [Ottowia sp.]HPZ56408.1 TIGR00730 family Rossman fold protein [Ottowia sp.]HQD47276.1 TIGR00730 family Rossman fold protein [Ottowia sp.]